MEKFKGYADEYNFVHEVEYEVLIRFKVNLSDQEIKNFILENLSGIKILEAKNNIAKLLWPLEAFSGEEEIVLEMYELLDDCELGTYEYTRIN